jgi:hypothetical protein
MGCRGDDSRRGAYRFGRTHFTLRRLPTTPARAHGPIGLALESRFTIEMFTGAPGSGGGTDRGAVLISGSSRGMRAGQTGSAGRRRRRHGRARAGPALRRAVVCSHVRVGPWRQTLFSCRLGFGAINDEGAMRGWPLFRACLRTVVHRCRRYHGLVTNQVLVLAVILGPLAAVAGVAVRVLFRAWPFIAPDRTVVLTVSG